LESLQAVSKAEWQHNANTFKRSTDVFSRDERALAAIETIVQHKPGALQWLRKPADELVVLRAELVDLWRDQPVFEKVRQLTGEVAREMPDRQTLRFECNGRAYYRKWHRGVGWREIVKNLVRLRWPVLGARNEWEALNKMRALGVPGLIPVAYGVRGKNPARQESFIITRELSDVIQLDHFFEQRQVSARAKRAIVAKVASIARELHAAGINHRDFYLCHFMLREASLFGAPEITLVDLHRAQLRIAVPERWLVKDLGLFST
jgi:UDP-glucose:(heptosyl)LPS alpha-1,3-glucosyltransferase